MLREMERRINESPSGTQCVHFVGVNLRVSASFPRTGVDRVQPRAPPVEPSSYEDYSIRAHEILDCVTVARDLVKSSLSTHHIRHSMCTMKKGVIGVSTAGPNYR